LAGCLLIALYPLILSAGLYLMDVSANVSNAASEYFKIRMFSAPATLMNFAILGYVLGKGQGRLGLLLQTLINGSNIVLSFYLGLKLQWGIQGVAYGTFFAEYLGVVVGLFIVLRSFKITKRPAFSYIFNVQASKKLMALNGDIMIRSLALVGAFAWFTRVGGQFGDTTLAANAILINFLLLAGYLLDGFATAAEQMAGRAIGANYREGFIKIIKLTLYWGFALAAVMMLLLVAFGPLIINITTTEPVVRDISYEYYLWAALISVTGVLAFQMDGIFIGATWSSDMRNMMLISLVIFVVTSIYLADIWGNHGLWLSLNLFMLIRGISLSLILPQKIKTIFLA
jgi:MATE family multidrug resistance protein